MSAKGARFLGGPGDMLPQIYLKICVFKCPFPAFWDKFRISLIPIFFLLNFASVKKKKNPKRGARSPNPLDPLPGSGEMLLWKILKI